MTIGKVIGSFEGAIKHPSYQGAKMLAVQPLDAQGNPTGRTQPAMDMAGAGEGDVVLIVEEGKAVRERLGEQNVPVRTLIIGIVDEVDTFALEKATTQRIV